MTAIGLRADVKKLFFDRGAVVKSIRADERRYMARAGARGMWLMRNQIRRKLKRKVVYRRGMSPQEYTAARMAEQKRVASKPGESPRGKVFKKTIFFAFDPPRGVVIGPVAFRKGQGVPAVLEEGGRVDTTFYGLNGTRTHRVVAIEPRPYRAPALRKLLPEIPGIIRSSVRK